VKKSPVNLPSLLEIVAHPDFLQIGCAAHQGLDDQKGLGEGQLDRQASLQRANILHITRQILGALSEAHRHGIVHRDLKPENVMVIRGSGPPRVKVLDFGLSKLVDRPLDASLTEVGRVMGTPLYMSPEQVAGDPVDHRTDLYAVGLILYEMLAGRTPFSGKTLQEILSKHLKELPPSVIELVPELKVPAALDRVLEHALEKRREDRYQSADEMLDALNEVDPSGPNASLDASRLRRQAAHGGPASPAGSSAAGRWVAGAALLAVIVSLALWLTLGPDEAGASGARSVPRQRDTPAMERTGAQDVKITSVRAESEGDTLLEKLHLAFSKVKVTYVPQGKTGGRGGGAVMFEADTHAGA
jgi:serine/threonine-protein kinase